MAAVHGSAQVLRRDLDTLDKKTELLGVPMSVKFPKLNPTNLQALRGSAERKQYRVESLLINLDKLCDFIPGLSTVTNVVNIFQKIFVVPCASNEYHDHLRKKTFYDCVTLLIPAINCVVAFSTEAQREYEKLTPQEKLKWDNDQRISTLTGGFNYRVLI